MGSGERPRDAERSRTAGEGTMNGIIHTTLVTLTNDEFTAVTDYAHSRGISPREWPDTAIPEVCILRRGLRSWTPSSRTVAIARALRSGLVKIGVGYYNGSRFVGGPQGGDLPF